jgi:hypothetical protein
VRRAAPARVGADRPGSSYTVANDRHSAFGSDASESRVRSV